MRKLFILYFLAACYSQTTLCFTQQEINTRVANLKERINACSIDEAALRTAIAPLPKLNQDELLNLWRKRNCGEEKAKAAAAAEEETGAGAITAKPRSEPIPTRETPKPTPEKVEAPVQAVREALIEPGKIIKPGVTTFDEPIGVITPTPTPGPKPKRALTEELPAPMGKVAPKAAPLTPVIKPELSKMPQPQKAELMPAPTPIPEPQEPSAEPLEKAVKELGEKLGELAKAAKPEPKPAPKAKLKLAELPEDKTVEELPDLRERAIELGEALKEMTEAKPTVIKKKLAQAKLAKAKAHKAVPLGKAAKAVAEAMQAMLPITLEGMLKAYGNFTQAQKAALEVIWKSAMSTAEFGTAERTALDLLRDGSFIRDFLLKAADNDIAAIGARILYNFPIATPTKEQIAKLIDYIDVFRKTIREPKLEAAKTAEEQATMVKAVKVVNPIVWMYDFVGKGNKLYKGTTYEQIVELLKPIKDSLTKEALRVAALIATGCKMVTGGRDELPPMPRFQVKEDDKWVITYYQIVKYLDQAERDTFDTLYNKLQDAFPEAQ